MTPDLRIKFSKTDLDDRKRFYMREFETANALQKRGLPSNLTSHVMEYDAPKYLKDHFAIGYGNTRNVDRTPGDFGIHFPKERSFSLQHSQNVQAYNALPELDQRLYRHIKNYYNDHNKIMSTIDAIKKTNYLFTDYTDYYNKNKNANLINPRLMRRAFPEPTIYRKSKTPLPALPAPLSMPTSAPLSIKSLPPLKSISKHASSKRLSAGRRKTRKHKK